ncbi:MAG: HlyD family efflux transporter periplasmic adaptor subunit [SAR324 cluster bacterium]|nr:HlyD family efflux transporter periplasmic adaptor subunit [SAR324 cluster bacterium]
MYPFISTILIILLNAGVVLANPYASILRENYKITLVAQQSGRINLLLSEGTPIKQGSPLFEIERQELQIALQMAEAQWKKAQQYLSKVKNPYSEEERRNAELIYSQKKKQFEAGAISPEAFGLVESQYEMKITPTRAEDIAIAEEEVKLKHSEMLLAQTAIEKTSELAPANFGVIQRIRVYPGQWVRQGQEIMEIIGVHPLQMEVYIPLSESAKLTRGKILKVEINMGNAVEKTRGSVVFISSEVDAIRQTLLIKMEINNVEKRYSPGMLTNVYLP